MKTNPVEAKIEPVKNDLPLIWKTGSRTVFISNVCKQQQKQININLYNKHYKFSFSIA